MIIEMDKETKKSLLALKEELRMVELTQQIEEIELKLKKAEELQQSVAITDYKKQKKYVANQLTALEESSKKRNSINSTDN